MRLLHCEIFGRQSFLLNESEAIILADVSIRSHKMADQSQTAVGHSSDVTAGNRFSFLSYVIDKTID